MRSGAGVFCPRSRRLECLLDLFPRDLLPTAGFAELRVAFAGGAEADHTAPAVSSSARPAVIDVRSLIQPRLSISIAPMYIANGRESAIELLLVSRWYDTWQEHRKGAVAIAATQDFEHYVHSGL